MIYFKSLLAGIAAGLAGAVMWIAAALFAPIAIAVLGSRFAGAGAGGAGASVGSGSIAIVAALAFVVGFYWQFRRASTPRPSSGGRRGLRRNHS